MTTKVSGYKKSDGTKVRGHTRAQPLHQRLNTWAQRGADSGPVTAMSLAGLAFSVILATLYAGLSVVYALLMATTAVALACAGLFMVKKRSRRRRRRKRPVAVRVLAWNRKRRVRRRAERTRTTKQVNSGGSGGQRQTQATPRPEVVHNQVHPTAAARAHFRQEERRRAAQRRRAGGP